MATNGPSKWKVIIKAPNMPLALQLREDAVKRRWSEITFFGMKFTFPHVVEPEGLRRNHYWESIVQGDGLHEVAVAVAELQ